MVPQKQPMDMNTVISWGLIIMGNLSVAGWIAISILTGTNNGTEIPLSIASGLVGVLTGKKLAENRIIGNLPPDVPEAIARTNAQLKQASALADAALDLIEQQKKKGEKEDANE